MSVPRSLQPLGITRSMVIPTPTQGSLGVMVLANGSVVSEALSSFIPSLIAWSHYQKHGWWLNVGGDICERR